MDRQSAFFQSFFLPKAAPLRERATELYIYVMLLVYPLFTGFWGYSRITDSKFGFFAAATLAWLAVLAFAPGGRRFSLRDRPAAEKCVLVYLVLCVVSALLSPDGTKTLAGAGRWDGLLTTALCCAAFFGCARFARMRSGYLFAAALSAGVNCVVALLQLAGFDPLRLFPSGCTFYDAGVRFSSVFFGTIGNADLFAAYLCLVLPLTMAYYITSRKRNGWLAAGVFLFALSLFFSGVSGGALAFAVCLLCGAPFVLTDGERLRRALELAAVVCLAACAASPLRVITPAGGGAVTIGGRFSRLSLLLPAAAACFVLLRLLTAKKQFRSRNLKRFFASLSLLLAAGAVAAVWFYPGKSGTLFELSQVLHGHAEDGYGSSRVLIWRKLLALVPARPLLGYGPGTLSLHLDVHFSRYVAQTGKTISTYVDNAHNVYLGILANTGALSLAAYLAAMAVSLRRAVRSRARFAAPLACALLCYWVQDFFGLGLFLVSPLMWVLWGLAVRENAVKIGTRV